MKDEIIYCSNIEQLRQELKDNGMYDEETDSYSHRNTLTPIKRNVNGESLSLVRNNKLDMTLFPSLTSLGTYEELFADNVALDKYKSVYPYSTELFYVNDDGETIGYFLSPKIGVFA